MSRPIHFQGTDYDSVAVMPPSIRAAYEQWQRDTAKNKRGLEAGAEAQDDEDEDDEQDEDEPLTPAWGGARQPGSVPAPMGFEQVTGLGPVVAVHEHKGLQILPKLGTPHVTMLVEYHDGLACRTSGKDVHSWRWDEVAVIQTNLTHHSEKENSWTDHEYTLTKTNGEKLILGDEIKDVWGAAESIKQAVFALSGPPLVRRYQAGEAMAFGPVTAQRQTGLQLEGQRYAWGAIQDVKVKDGRFLVTLSDGKKHEAPVSAIPNIELLCRVIGLNLDSEQLVHRSWW